MEVDDSHFKGSMPKSIGSSRVILKTILNVITGPYCVAVSLYTVNVPLSKTLTSYKMSKYCIVL